MPQFEINKDMLSMKGHYFLFNAGTAPLVPYLSTYAKQLGFSSYIVGIIYTFLPIFGLIAKPVFGAIGDRYERHKLIFVFFQIFTILSFSGLYFIKEMAQEPVVHLSCGNGESFFDTCSTNVTMNECSTADVLSSNETVHCDMSCTMDNPLMWQTVCEDWKISKYCYNMSNYYDISKNSQYYAKDDCLFFDVLSEQDCALTEKYPVYANCYQICGNNTIVEINNEQHLVCDKNSTKLKMCSKSGIESIRPQANCKLHCTQTKEHTSSFCVNSNNNGLVCRTTITDLPDTLNFTGIIPLDKSLEVGECVYFYLHQIQLDDGTVHYPVCSKESTSYEHFHSQCKTVCANNLLSEYLSSSTETTSAESSQHSQLWMFFMLMALNWIGMAVVVSIADAICFEKLGENVGRYGQQRLWGSAGWGIFSLLTGYLIDTFSQNQQTKNYLIAFILMFIFLCLDVIVSIRLKYRQNKISVNLVHKVGLLFRNRQICHFFVWIVLVGMCTGLLWQFLFWYLEDLATAFGCSQSNWIKTLQGFVSGIQCFLGEIPFLFFSGRILKKIGHTHTMSLVLLGFGIRFILYSLLVNPWWVLPIELLQGLTFGLLYANMASYASIIAPEGTEATLQGLVGAVFEGVGTSLGSLIGGMMYGKFGGVYTFRTFGCVALGACILNVAFTYLFCKGEGNKSPQITEPEYTSIIHYAVPNDDIDLFNEY